MAATPRNDIGMIVYAPALVARDERPVATVHAMERALPRLHLVWTTSLDGTNTLLAHRDAWLVQHAMARDFPLVHNGDDRSFASVSGVEAPATSAPGGKALLEVHAKLPRIPEAIAAAADVLEGVAEASHAFWGHATPFSAALDIAHQTQNPDLPPKAPPRGLPAIKIPWEFPSPEIPEYLGWLNYWSAAAARIIGFPDPARDAELLTRARRTATGGWVVQLTQAPLELDDPAHLAALLRAYERFPHIGGRTG
jgi:hypothetical protein